MITDASRQGDPLTALRVLPEGTLVILRDYDHPGRTRLAQDLARACRRRGLLFSVAGSGRLAAKVQADGLHLPEAQAHRAMAWRQRRKDWLITVSAHGFPALRRAQLFRADAALLAPAFSTTSHPGAPSLGLLRFARLVTASPVPVYALGGISPQTARRLKGTGCAGLAAISAFAPTREARTGVKKD